MHAESTTKQFQVLMEFTENMTPIRCSGHFDWKSPLRKKWDALGGIVPEPPSNREHVAVTPSQGQARPPGLKAAKVSSGPAIL